jgi:hypothetical protein
MRHDVERKKAGKAKRRTGPTWEIGGCWLVGGFVGVAAMSEEKAVRKSLATTRRIIKQERERM